MTDDQKLAKVWALSDQAWAVMRERWPDIQRIADGGFDGTDEDRLLIRTVFLRVSADLHLRACGGGTS